MTLTLGWLDYAGLALAIIGFFNLAGPLERFFEGVRELGRLTRLEAQRRLKTRLPVKEHVPELLWDGVVSALGICTYFGMNYLLDEKVQSRWGELLIWPWWITILAGIGVFVLLIFNGMVGFFTGGWFATIYGTLMWRFFWLLGKAPAGIVGSIGLLVTVGSILASQLSSNA